MQKNSKLFILVGPSGAGKTTLLSRLTEEVESLEQMPTGTTRQQRAGEIHGGHHLFLSEEEFDLYKGDGELVEWQQAHDVQYGTVRSVLERALNSERDHIADIDVFGAFRLKELYPNNIILVFVTPSSAEVLENRIRQRGSLIEKEVASRLKRAQMEFMYLPECDYVVINDDLEEAREQLEEIVLAVRCHRLLTQ